MAREQFKEHIIKWFYEPAVESRFRIDSLQFGRAKGFLYQAAHRSISKHDLYECYQLLKTLPKKNSIDPYILYRLILILLESNGSQVVHQNAIFYLEAMLSTFDLSKLDVFLEFLIYLVRHKRIDEARVLFSLRNKYIAQVSHKPLPTTRLNINCYELLLNYLDWDEKEVKNKFDESIQGWIVNGIVSLRDTNGNYEYFVTCVVKVLLHYKYYKKAYIFVSHFQRNNPNNIGIQLFLKRLLEHLCMISNLDREENDEVAMLCDTGDSEQERNWNREFQNLNNFSLVMDNESFVPEIYPVKEDKKRILNNLILLDPTREEIIELMDSCEESIESIKTLMDGLEFLYEMRNIDRWKSIQAAFDRLRSSGNTVLINELNILWEKRYKMIWSKTDFNRLTNFDSDGQHVIRQVLDFLKSFETQKPEHQFHYLPDYCKPGYIDSCPSDDSS